MRRLKLGNTQNPAPYFWGHEGMLPPRQNPKIEKASRNDLVLVEKDMTVVGADNATFL